MIKAVIFDLDNTLYDFDSLEPPAYERAESFIITELGITSERFRKALSIGKGKVKARLGNVAASHSRLLYFQAALEDLGAFSIDLAIKASEIFWRAVFDEMRPRPGVTELLNKLKMKGVLIAVCTDLTADIQMRKLIKLEISEYIDVLVTSEEAGVEKPNGRIFRLCLEKLGLCPTECLMVGDSDEKDIAGARALGISAVLLDKYCPGDALLVRLLAEII
jgi:putative hydrolase of the HAD superfamily